MISIILLTHNYRHYLDDCINSIKRNEQSKIGEILIIDDASTDGTKKLVLRLKKKYKKIKYYKKNFLSLSKSYNYGIKKSKYKYISKIDADDMYNKDFLKLFFTSLKKNNYDFICGNLKLINNKKKIIYIKKQKINNFNSIFKYPVGSGTIFKKEIWKKVKGFDETIRYQDDYDFWLKLKKLKNIKFGYLDKVAYNYRMHQKNMSKSLIKKNIIKLYVLLKNII